MKILSRSSVIATLVALFVVSCYAEADEALLHKHDSLECYEAKGPSFNGITEIAGKKHQTRLFLCF